MVVEAVGAVGVRRVEKEEEDEEAVAARSRPLHQWDRVLPVCV